MTTKQATEILSEMNKWRRAEGKYKKDAIRMPYSEEELWDAIDTIVGAFYNKKPFTITKDDYRKIIDNIFGGEKEKFRKQFEDWLLGSDLEVVSTIKDIGISSRMKYIKDEKAMKIAEFLFDYCFKDIKEVYTNGTILVPMFRVLDALIMINQDKIQYNEG